MEDWKIAIGEGVRKTKAFGKKTRIYTTDKETGEAIFKIVKQNIKSIPPGYCNKITGTAANCKDFTVHFDNNDDADTFSASIDSYAGMVGDYNNGATSSTATTTTETEKSSSNKLIIIVAVVFAAAIGYYLWKRAK